MAHPHQKNGRPEESVMRAVRAHRSMRPALKLDAIVVQGANWETRTIAEVRVALERLFCRQNSSAGVVSVKVLPNSASRERGGPQMTPSTTAATRAFVNFTCERTASAAITSLRSTGQIFGKPVKMMYSTGKTQNQSIKDDEEVREMLTVVIRNLSSGIAMHLVEAKLASFGEILRSHVQPSPYDPDTRQALIQYIDASAAQAALRASENRQIRLQNMIITVEPYLRRQDAGGGGGGYGSVSDAAWDGDSSTGHPSRPPSQYGPSPSQVGSLAGSMHNGAARASDAGALLEEAMPEALPEALPEVSRLGLHNGGGGGSGGAAAVYENGLNLEELQDCVCCPITHDVFRDPVMAPDGTVYERVAIEDWLTRHHVSPVSREPMRIEALKPVRAIAVTLKALQVVQQENEALKERLQILKQICNEPFQCSRLF